MRIKIFVIALLFLFAFMLIFSGCSAESKYEKAFLESYNTYNSNVATLFESVDYFEENPNNAPEYYNDEWVIEAYMMFTSEIINDIEQLEAPYEYREFDTTIWLYYVYLYNYLKGEEEGLSVEESQELFDMALSCKNPINKE